MTKIEEEALEPRTVNVAFTSASCNGLLLDSMLFMGLSSVSVRPEYRQVARIGWCRNLPHNVVRSATLELERYIASIPP